MTAQILDNKDHTILNSAIKKYSVIMIRLPDIERKELNLFPKKPLKTRLYRICQLTNFLTSRYITGKTIVFVGPLHVLSFVYKSVNKNFKYHDLVAIRLENLVPDKNFLANEHLGLIIFSTRKAQVYNPVKVPFEFCKSCNNTVKD